MESGNCVINPPTKLNKHACACSLVASIITIIFGYDTGVISGAMIFIKEEFDIKEVQLEVVAGILNFCALVGALFAGRTSDFIGRRYTIIVASLIFLAGSILMGYSPNYGVLLGGRCTAGVGVGFALMIAPVYSAEISPTGTRGQLSSLPEVGIALGILLGYVSNFIFAKLPLHIGWRVMLGIAALPSLLLAIGLLKMPESPRWLILQGRLKEAKKVLDSVSNDPEEAERRFADIKKAAGIEGNVTEDIPKLPGKRNTHGQGVWKELLIRPTEPVRWILLAGVGIHFFEHACGIEAVILYGPTIFKKAGVKSKSKLLLATIGIGLIKFICTLTSSFLMDRVGRRKLLLTSVTGMIISLTLLATCLTIIEHSSSSLLWALVLSLIGVYSYVTFYNLGLAPVTWVYSSEIFPLKLRAQGAAIGVAVNRFMNATVSMSFLSICAAITIGGAFFMFAGVSVLAWMFFYFFCPETKGRALEEMEAIFSRRKHDVSRRNGAAGEVEIAGEKEGGRMEN